MKAGPRCWSIQILYLLLKKVFGHTPDLPQVDISATKIYFCSDFSKLYLNTSCQKPVPVQFFERCTYIHRHALCYCSPKFFTINLFGNAVKMVLDEETSNGMMMTGSAGEGGSFLEYGVGKSSNTTTIKKGCKGSGEFFISVPLFSPCRPLIKVAAAS